MGFSRKHHRFQFLKLCEAYRDQTKFLVLDSRPQNGGELPSRINSWVKLHVSRAKHVAHEAACTPSTCVPFCTRSPFQELRIKYTFFISFGIIINYYPQGPKPLSLASLPTFHPPLSYPLYGSLVTHHSFFMVGLHTTMFNLY
jgi:hypothetical protein